MVGSLLGWKSLLTKRRTREDWGGGQQSAAACAGRAGCSRGRTFPTAASPSSTSLTLLLGLGAEAVESAMEGEGGRFARSERPTLYVDSLAAGAASAGGSGVDEFRGTNENRNGSASKRGVDQLLRQWGFRDGGVRGSLKAKVDSDDERAQASGLGEPSLRPGRCGVQYSTTHHVRNCEQHGAISGYRHKSLFPCKSLHILPLSRRPVEGFNNAKEGGAWSTTLCVAERASNGAVVLPYRVWKAKGSSTCAPKESPILPTCPPVSSFRDSPHATTQ